MVKRSELAMIMTHKSCSRTFPSDFILPPIDAHGMDKEAMYVSHMADDRVMEKKPMLKIGGKG